MSTIQDDSSLQEQTREDRTHKERLTYGYLEADHLGGHSIQTTKVGLHESLES